MYNTSDVLPEFSAQEVTLQVLDRLERRRAQVVSDPALVDAGVDEGGVAHHLRATALQAVEHLQRHLLRGEFGQHVRGIVHSPAVCARATNIRVVSTIARPRWIAWGGVTRSSVTRAAWCSCPGS